MAGALSLGLASGLTLAQFLGTGLTGAVGPPPDHALLKFQRGIDTGQGYLLIPDCIIEETGRDDLQITEHPIEFGSTISDHAFKRPREVTLRWAWSNSSRQYETAVLDIYNYLLGVQQARQPFVIYTGKSMYQNMVIASIGQTTNNEYEYALMCVIVCKEVIIVSTETTTAAPRTPAAPATNGKTVNGGNKQVVSKGSGFGGGITSFTQFRAAQAPDALLL